MPPSTQINPDPSPLEIRLKEVIRQRGPISVADFMADALYHPQDGYYMTASPLGADGDFTTAPEISQVFGEIIGLWLIQSWIDMGSPSPFMLVELGPGRGTLMADILRAARLRPEFIAAAEVWFVETSGLLRHQQQKTLKIHGEVEFHWADRFNEVPEGPTLLVANEFFDCLPVRQFEFKKTGWHERMVGIDWDTENLAFVTHEAPSVLDYSLARHGNPVPGDIIEIGTPARNLAAEIADAFTDDKGRALIIDYGPSSSGFGDSLQAVRNHKFWPALMTPGRADLTVHVDFQALGDAALHEGATFYGPQTQGTFLDKLGLALRVEALCKSRPDHEQEAIRQGAYRLVDASQMGELFKVLCLASPELPPPAGFEGIPG